MASRPESGLCDVSNSYVKLSARDGPFPFSSTRSNYESTLSKHLDNIYLSGRATRPTNMAEAYQKKELLALMSTGANKREPFVPLSGCGCTMPGRLSRRARSRVTCQDQLWAAYVH